MNLKHHIDYFNKEDICFYIWNDKHPVYDEGVDEFVNEFYKSNLIDPNYIENIEALNLSKELEVEFIKESNIDLLKSILTMYIRGERFNDGFWVDAIDKKIFLNILLRIHELN